MRRRCVARREHADKPMKTPRALPVAQRVLFPLAAASFVVSQIFAVVPGFALVGGVAILIFASIAPGLLFVSVFCGEDGDGRGAGDGIGRTSVLCLSLSPFFTATGTLLFVFASGEVALDFQKYLI